MKRVSRRLTLILLTTLTTITITLNIALAVTWSDDNRLTWIRCFDGLPAITQMNDGSIWILWETDIRGDTDIAYRIYDGVSWTDPDLLTFDSSNDIHPAILQAENGTIWVFWSSDKAGNYDIFYMTSSDNGLSWSDATPLTTSLNEDNAASAAQKADGTIWLVWQRKLSGYNYDILYKIYDGSAWSNEEPLVTDPSQDQVPAITDTVDGNMWVVWCSYRTGDFEIYYKIHNGSSWSDDEFRLTYSTNSDTEPSVVQARDGTIYIVWTSSEPKQTATDELYYTTSADNGATWSDLPPLASASNYDNMWSSIAQMNNKTLCVAFTSNRYDNYDIYTKTSSEILFHDVAITSVTPSPTVVDLGEIVSIDVVAENQGDMAENFNVTCYVNSTPIGSETVLLDAQSFTTLNFLWDTSTYGVGLYDISANASAVAGETSVNLEDNVYLEREAVLIAGHDLAMISVSTSESLVAQGYFLKIYVTVKNKGNIAETFGVTAYYGSIAVETQTVSDLDAGAYTDLTFNWNTTDVPYGDYVVSATAEGVPGEIETGDNSMTDGTVKVTIPGDVDGDVDVDLEDLMLIARALGTDPRYPPGTDWNYWNPNCDIDNNLKVDGFDLYLTGRNYGSGLE